MRNRVTRIRIFSKSRRRSGSFSRGACRWRGCPGAAAELPDEGVAEAGRVIHYVDAAGILEAGERGIALIEVAK